MGLSAVSEAKRSDREALLGRIELRSAAWRRLLGALAEGSPGGEGRALADELRALAREATSSEMPLLAEELSGGRAIVQGALVLGRLDEHPRRELEASFERLGRYAAEQKVLASPRGQRRTRRGISRVAAFASQRLVDGLLAEDWSAEDDAPALRVERIARAPRGPLPDVLVVDLDEEGAKAFALEWLDSPATEAVPVVLLGIFDSAEASAELVARGASRILPKPASPGALRRACVEVGGVRAGPFEPIGETNVERLGLRLASELQRGLGDAVDGKARSASFDLGGGAEVLTVLWDAVARIRELVAAQSKGVVRFGPAGPIDALPKACWLDSGRRDKGQRAASRGEVREGGTGRLNGRRVLVVEDDLSVNWFLAGVLKQAGAEVVSARHGKEALEIAFREPPDLVLSDVVMPELDGLSLRRALARDVRLRSVPVIMLSWKDDLLQRMRELGVEAHGYLRKQATDREIVQRVLEVLRGRRAVAERIEAEGTVRGRLDELTACDLLEMVARLRPDARITLRDARYTTEIDIRGGRPVAATRTAADGHSDRGPVVIASLLGIGAGRFGIEALPPGAALSAELEGSLAEQLLVPVARVRAAERLLSGASLLRTDRVILDEPRVATLLTATPEPARALFSALTAGISPRELVLSGRAAAELVERVLADAARQGVVTAIRQGGVDVFGSAVEREVAVQAGDTAAARASVAILAESLAGEALDDPSPVPAAVDDEAPDSFDEPAPVWLERDATPARRSYLPSPAHTPMLATAVESPEAVRHHTPVWSSQAEQARLAELDPAPAPVVVQAPSKPADDAREDLPSAREERRRERREARAERDEEVRERRRDDYDDAGEPRLPRLPGPSAWATRSPEPPPKRSSYTWPLVFGLIGIALAVGARWFRQQQPPPPAPAMILPAAPPAPAAAPEAASPEAAPSAVAAPPTEPEAQRLPLTEAEAEKLGKGEGMLEVVVGRNDVVHVGGKEIGRGPVVKVPLLAKKDAYEVRVQMRGEERVRYVTVEAGVRTRLRVAPPWSR